MQKTFILIELCLFACLKVYSAFVDSYDDKYHSLVTRVEDAYGYSSSTEYDALWNAPKTTTDLNGEKMEYEYDDLGRPTCLVILGQIR